MEERKSPPSLRRVPGGGLTSSEAEEDLSYDEHANACGLDEITRIVQSIDAFWFQVVRLSGEGEEPVDVDP